MRMRALGICILSASLGGLSGAGSPARAGDKAQDHFVRELIECAAYYNALAESLWKASDEEGADKAEECSAMLLEQAGNYLSDNVVLSVFREELQNQCLDLGKDNAALPAVRERYDAVCGELVRNPNDRYRYWRKMKP